MKLSSEDSLLLWFQGHFHPNSGALQYGNSYWPLLTCEANAESSSSLQGMLWVWSTKNSCYSRFTHNHELPKRGKKEKS
jgi:hypothetical protein